MKGIFKKKAKSILTSVLSVMMFCSLGLGFGALKQTTVEAENKGDTEYYVPVGVASAG